MRLLQRRNIRNIDIAGSMPEVMRSLHVDPNRRTTAQQLAQSNRHLGSNGLLLIQDVVKRLPRYAEVVGNCRLADSQRRQNDFSQNLARMGRTSFWVANTHNIRSQTWPISVMPFQINISSVSIKPTIRESPMLRYLDSVTAKTTFLPLVKPTKERDIGR
jgi:hypothetical protein